MRTRRSAVSWAALRASGQSGGALIFPRPHPGAPPRSRRSYSFAMPEHRLPCEAASVPSGPRPHRAGRWMTRIACSHTSTLTLSPDCPRKTPPPSRTKWDPLQLCLSLSSSRPPGPFAPLRFQSRRVLQDWVAQQPHISSSNVRSMFYGGGEDEGQQIAPLGMPPPVALWGCV